MVSNAELAGALRHFAIAAEKADARYLAEAAGRLEGDAQAIEWGEEILGETRVGLAWAAGDAEPPKTCCADCRLPHLGPRAHQAIRDGLKALREGAWNPPAAGPSLDEMKSWLRAMPPGTQRDSLARMIQAREAS